LWRHRQTELFGALFRKLPTGGCLVQELLLEFWVICSVGHALELEGAFEIFGNLHGGIALLRLGGFSLSIRHFHRAGSQAGLPTVPALAPDREAHTMRRVSVAAPAGRCTD
jgi:hypothetical protein